MEMDEITLKSPFSCSQWSFKLSIPIRQCPIYFITFSGLKLRKPNQTCINIIQLYFTNTGGKSEVLGKGEGKILLTLCNCPCIRVQSTFYSVYDANEEEREEATRGTKIYA